jgi:predicted O-linked N-acetylglucosamine transferase (SPINDLY family)
MALSLNAENEIARSCLLFCSQYHPLLTMEELYNESILWPRFCTKDIQCTTNHPNLPIPDRPIKIGLVSADFKIHPVGYYLLSYMHNHDSEKYPVVCYSNSELVDIFTERFKTYADEWRDVTKLTDNELFSLIISDGVDILVDLSGHTEGNRLRLFAMKPAPVQATWIGFFFTTGLSEIDYILMDDVSVLPGEERYFSEKVYRLPQTRFCYEPPALAPDVTPLPFTRNNYITFGSFNNLAKVTHQVIQLWARVLSEIPNSRLLLKTASLGSERVREEVATTFESFGISRERLILRNESSYVDMLGEYGDMDIALDPFPFNGGLTSCEALWMGVPVITLAGNRPIARQTTSFIKCIDIDDLIAKNEAEYVELAMKWSNNINKLMEIRKLLRSKMQSSLLCDGRRFTVNLESAFRWMWVDWCKSG